MTRSKKGKLEQQFTKQLIAIISMTSNDVIEKTIWLNFNVENGDLCLLLFELGFFSFCFPQ